MKNNIPIRTVGLILSISFLVLCPVATVLFSRYVVSHYPPTHYPPLPPNPDNNAWASKILGYISAAHPIAAVVAIICARGWKWRVALAVLAFIALIIGFGVSFGAGMNVTGQEP